MSSLSLPRRFWQILWVLSRIQMIMVFVGGEGSQDNFSSGTPIASPIGQPISHQPIATTPVPTLYPTIVPTSLLTLQALWQDKIDVITDEYEVMAAAAVASSGNKLVWYLDGNFRGSNLVSTATNCSMWSNFLFQLQVQRKSYKVKSISIQTLESLSSDLGNALDICCRDTTTCTEIIDSLFDFDKGKRTSSSTMRCSTTGYSDSVWTTGYCYDGAYISASNSGSDSGTTSSATFSPCSSASCGLSSTSSTIIRAVLVELVPINAPPAFHIISVTATTSSAEVVVDLTAGQETSTLYCAAMDAFAFNSLTSVEAILLNGASARASSENQVNVTVFITGLSPVTKYRMVCAVVSAQGLTTPLQTSLTKAVAIQTKCCRHVVVSLLRSVVMADASAVSDALTVGVESPPSATLTVTLKLTKEGQLFQQLSPGIVIMAANVSSHQSVALLSLPRGNYHVQVNISGVNADWYEVMYVGGRLITSLNSTDQPRTPALLSASFAADGASLLLSFDSCTDAGSLESKQFPCSKQFSFSDASFATCQWNKAKTLVTVWPSPTSTLMSDDVICLLGGVIKAMCPASSALASCSSWSYAGKQSVNITGPVSTEFRPPVVLIIGPSAVGFGSNLTVDVSASTGAGGRPWTNASIFAFASTSTTSGDDDSTTVAALQTFLSSDSTKVALLANMALTIPASLLQANTKYVFTVVLCNFLDSCGQAQTSVTVLEAEDLPVVSIVSPPVVTVFTNKSLTLKAAAFTYNSTVTGEESSADLTYRWSISARSANGVLSSVPSLVTSSLYSISSFTLTPLNTYDVTVMVSSATSSSIASVVLIVGQGSVRAVIRDAVYRSCRVSQWIMLDGSLSSDTDDSESELTFTWTMYQQLPGYTSSCSVNQSSSNTEALWRLYGFANATNTTCVVWLSVSESNRYDSSSTKIGFVAASAPLVSVSTTPTALARVSASAQLSVLVTVNLLNDSISCSWNVDDSTLSLSTILLTSSTITLPSVTSAVTAMPFNLVVAASSLRANAQFTFSLTCFSSNGGGSISGTSVTSVVISTNLPPTPGAFVMNPTAGQSMQTLFKFVAKSWSDDGNYPLSFEYGFYPSSSAAMAIVSSRSPVGSASAVLPVGPASASFALKCQVNVYDSLNAASSASATVTVTANTSATASLAAVLTFLKSSVASAGQDTDKVKQVLLGTATVVHRVSCLQAPNCSALNRVGCSTVPNTCGPCKGTGSYVGTAGSSNDLCLLASTASIATNASCDADTDCSNGWFLCDTVIRTCYSPSKQCAENCSGHGTCGFVDADSDITLTSCLANDITCSAKCSCNAGYFGDTCSLTASQLATHQAIHAQLIASFAAVISIENNVGEVSASSVTAWANSLVSVVAIPSLLGGDTVAATLAVVGKVLEANSLNKFPFSTVSGLKTILDNCMAAVGINNGATATATNLRATLDNMTAVALSSMVAGQNKNSWLLSNCRAYLQVVSSTSSHTILTVPSSSGETALGRTGSQITLPRSLTGSESVSFVSLKSSIFGNSDSNSLSNSLRVSVSGAGYCNGREETNSTLTFRITNVANVSSSSIDPNITLITHCKADGNVNLVTAACPYSSNLTHYCDGIKAYTLRSSCPARVMVPHCVVLVGSDSMNCSVTAFSAAWIDCACDLCSFDTASTIRRRRLNQNDDDLMTVSKYTGEVQTLGMYLANDFATALSSADLSLKDVQRSIFVLIVFLLLWGSTMLAVSLVEGVRIVKSEYTRKRSSKTSPDNLIPADISLETAIDLMKEYVFTFFPNTFSEKGEVSKFWFEVVHKHRYFSIFAREKGFRKFVGGLEILTLLTAHMFLIAVLFDAEWPTDDGFCKLQVAEVTCLSKKSIFKASDTLCNWVSQQTYNNTLGQLQATSSCQFQPPKYDVVVQIFLTMIVIAFSGPISALTSFVVNVIILSPSKQDVLQREQIVKTRRASAVSAISVAPHIRQASSQAGYDNKVFPSDDSVGQGSVVEESGPKAQMRRSFQEALKKPAERLPDLDESLKGYCVDNQQMRKHMMKLVVSPRLVTNRVPRGQHSSKIQQNRAAVSAIPAATPASAFIEELKIQQSQLSGPDLEKFLRHWGAVIFETPSQHLQEQPSNKRMDLLVAELESVDAMAKSMIKKLRGMPQTLIGVEILELFVLDLLGRGSREARLFVKQREAVKFKLVTHAGVKALALAALLALDGFFVFMCMVYGSLKGRQWQINWILSCLAYLVVDVFVKHMNIVFMVYYYIPHLIKHRTDGMKQRVLVAIESFVKLSYQSRGTKSHTDTHTQTVDGIPTVQQVQDASTAFSVSDYMFVSSIVARAFPNLLESCVVLSYRSLTSSDEQMARLHASRHGINADWQWEWQWRAVISTIALTVANALIYLGGQHIVLQKLVVQLLDPLIMGVVAFVGTSIVNDSLAGVPLVIGLLLLLVGAGMLVHRIRHAHDHAVNQSHTLPTPQPRAPGSTRIAQAATATLPDLADSVAAEAVAQQHLQQVLRPATAGTRPRTAGKGNICFTQEEEDKQQLKEKALEVNRPVSVSTIKRDIRAGIATFMAADSDFELDGPGHAVELDTLDEVEAMDWNADNNVELDSSSEFRDMETFLSASAFSANINASMEIHFQSLKAEFDYEGVNEGGIASSHIHTFEDEDSKRSVIDQQSANVAGENGLLSHSGIVSCLGQRDELDILRNL